MPSFGSNHPNADVRMRGFRGADDRRGCAGLGRFALPTFGDLDSGRSFAARGGGRVLARDVASRVNVPGFARAMMDGFAVGRGYAGRDVVQPLAAENSRHVPAGEGVSETVTAGAAVRIMTGAPLPDGADAVLPIEQTQLEGRRVWAHGRRLAGQARGTARRGCSRRRRGGACRAECLRPQDIGMLSSLGFSSAPVVRRPRVRILITGNELLPMGTPPTGYRITDANGPMLAALVRRDGGEPILGPIIPDDRDAILAAMRQEADVVLVSGGSSVGQEDHVPTLLAEHGELAVHGIAMRPSSPTGMGRLDGRLVFLLPGNPVSCLCAYDFFAGRAIRALGGRSRDWPYRRVTARLSRKLVSVVGRVDYARVHVRGIGRRTAGDQRASVLSSVTRADGFVIVPADSEGFPEGAEVDVFLYYVSIGRAGGFIPPG